MPKQEFENLDQVRHMLTQYEEMCDGSKDMAGMGALTVLASAMIKMVDEIQALNRRLDEHGNED